LEFAKYLLNKYPRLAGRNSRKRVQGFPSDPSCSGCKPVVGFHAFRHFNVSLLDALRVPLKTIQERAGHALTGVFTLDVYGGSPEWERNIEAGRLAGSEIEKAVSKLENERSSALVGSLLAIQEKRLGSVNS
jgi:hypothetical protein